LWRHSYFSNETKEERIQQFLTRLILTAEPPALANVTVHASTILALILWNVAGDGGHPIIDFTAQYRSAAPVNGSLEPWRPISPNHISPNSRQIDVYHLEPNASYWFRAWATNALGPGPPVEVLANTLYSDQDAECTEDPDAMELVPNIILNPGFMEMDPIRPRPQNFATSIIKSTECPGPGKPRRV
ncbi:Uncharacterized protein OBRU01_23850, partial [Operophtera brumata]